MPLAALGVALAGIGSPFVHMALDTHIGTNVDPRPQAALFGFQRLVMSVLSLLGAYAVVWWLTRTPGARPDHVGRGPGGGRAGGGLFAMLQIRSGSREQPREASP